MALLGVEETEEDRKRRLQSAAQSMLGGMNPANPPVRSTEPGGDRLFAGGTPWFDETTGGAASDELVAERLGIPVDQVGFFRGPATPTQPVPSEPSLMEQPEEVAKYGFTGDFARRELGLRQNLSDLDYARQQRQARLAQDFSNTLSRSATAQQRAAKQLQENLSGRGIARSGINLQATSEQNQDYQNYLADLGRQRARSAEDIEASYGSAQRDYFNQVAGLYNEQVQAETQRRIAEEKAKAEAIAKKEQARIQQEQLNAILAAQQAAQQAAQSAAQAAAARQQIQMPTTPSLGGGGGYNIDSGQWVDPNMRIALPSLAQGSNMNSVQQWVINNVAPSLAGDVTGLPAVTQALINAGGQGLTVDQIRRVLNDARTNYGVL